MISKEAKRKYDRKYNLKIKKREENTRGSII